MEKKYKLLENETKEFYGRTLYRVKALKSFGNVKAGDLGGFIEKEMNLSHCGDCWVYGEAMVIEDGRLFENAMAYGNALIAGDACASGNSRIFEYGELFGSAEIFDFVKLFGDGRVYGKAKIKGNVKVHGKAWISQDITIDGSHDILDNSMCFKHQFGVIDS